MLSHAWLHTCTSALQHFKNQNLKYSICQKWHFTRVDFLVSHSCMGGAATQYCSHKFSTHVITSIRKASKETCLNEIYPLNNWNASRLTPPYIRLSPKVRFEHCTSIISCFGSFCSLVGMQINIHQTKLLYSGPYCKSYHRHKSAQISFLKSIF